MYGAGLKFWVILDCAERARKATCTKGNPLFCGIQTCFSLCIVFVWLLISVQTRLCIRRAPRLIELKLKIYPGVSCIKIVLLQVLKGLSYLRENHSIIHRGRYYNRGKLLLVQNCMFHPEGNILLLMIAVVYIYLII